MRIYNDGHVAPGYCPYHDLLYEGSRLVERNVTELEKETKGAVGTCPDHGLVIESYRYYPEKLYPEPDSSAAAG